MVFKKSFDLKNESFLPPLNGRRTLILSTLILQMMAWSFTDIHFRLRFEAL
jgi:hypothetical protein